MHTTTVKVALAALLALSGCASDDSAIGKSCIREDDCGDTTMFGCDLSTNPGTCQRCGGLGQICCNTAICNGGLTCVLTPDLPRHCPAAPPDAGDGG